jgi:uncharacterized repeat protein (TIGR02543 family)
MGVMNSRLAGKAYMFEFVSTKGAEVKNEYFSFAVPPESEEFEFGQRITETKTFGGSVFDDYGNDTIPIKISGTTINDEKKMVYRGGSSREGLSKGQPRIAYLTGEKEIFELRKLINEWGKGYKINGKEIYIYDLSKMNWIQKLGGTNDNSHSPVRNYWRVVIKKFTIKRSKDKPLTYSYSIDMVGMLDDTRQLPDLFGNAKLKNVLDGIQKTIETIQAVADVTEFVADAIDEAKNAANDVMDTYDALASGDPAKIFDAVDSPVINLIGVSPRDLFNKGKSLVKSGEGLINRIKGSETDTFKSASQSRDDVFAVSFNSDGGTYVPPQKIPYSQKAERPVNPIKEKYSFSDWYTDEDFTEVYDFETEITGNVTLYAKWRQVTATVTFNSRGGSAVVPQSVKIGEKAEIPDPPPARNGYLFECWCTDIGVETQFNFNTLIEGDITLYARWKVVYTITFNSNGGSPVPKQIVNVGGKVIYPVIPIRDNYLFGAWCADSSLQNEYDFNGLAASSFTLYAKWTRVSNEVTFDSNGGSAVPPETVPIGGYAAEPNEPVREGFAFLRWCGDQALTDEFIFATTPVNYPTIIYAAWQINVETVTFNSDGGTEIEDQEIEYGGLVVYPPIPEKDGALFDRWCIDPGLAAEYDFSASVITSFTLYAKWFRGEQ